MAFALELVLQLRIAFSSSHIQIPDHSRIYCNENDE
jgi:hypothetical protein